MEIKDLAGLSEPFKKLIEVISSGIGILYKPQAIRNEAEAEAYKIEVIAKAEAKKIMLEGEAKIAIFENAKRRLVNQELIRQENIECIAEKSISHFNEKEASNEQVDKDWIFRFFDYAKDVSTDHVQEVWARILAREVENPGTVSLKTLEVLRNLGKREAEYFNKISKSILNGEMLVYSIDNYSEFRKAVGIESGEIERLLDFGLISPVDPHNIFFNNKNDSFVFTSKNRKFKVTIKSEKREIIKYRRLTYVGKELFSVIDIDENSEYHEFLKKELESRNFSVEVL